MKKLKILGVDGKKAREISTELFDDPIREDIISKVVESEKIKKPYSPQYGAGMNRSASGNTSKTRHAWKSDRGKGIPRLPRKIFWRRGTQFSWEAAIVPSTRGGRRAHPPKGSVNLKKINKRELKRAILSSLAYVSSLEQLKKKYSSLKDKKINSELPVVIESGIFQLKTKDILELLKNILGEFYEVAIQKRSIRAGIGKLRGRKNKRNAGLLFVTGNKEKISVRGIETVRVEELTVSDLASNGARLTVFSEGSIKDLEQFKKGKEQEK